MAFISDLHLLSARSNASQHQDLIARCIDEADLCVWGGDLFDFRWTRMANQADSVRFALRWLDNWCERFPATEFVYLDGNHDIHLSFRAGLAEFASSRSRFWAGLDCLRLNDTLLLHGDVIEGNGTADAFAEYRGRWQDKPIAGKFASDFYDVAIAARFHKAASFAAHRRRATCLRLIRWMHSQPADQIKGVARVVFGHTHRRIDAYRLHGIEFHNGGAAIRHVSFAPVMIDVLP